MVSYDMEQVWVCKGGICGMPDCLRCTTSQRGKAREDALRADLAKVTKERDEALAEVARLKRTVAHAHLRTHGHNPGACSGCESVERALGRTDGESK